MNEVDNLMNIFFKISFLLFKGENLSIIVSRGEKAVLGQGISMRPSSKTLTLSPLILGFHPPFHLPQKTSHHCFFKKKLSHHSFPQNLTTTPFFQKKFNHPLSHKNLPPPLLKSIHHHRTHTTKVTIIVLTQPKKSVHPPAKLSRDCQVLIQPKIKMDPPSRYSYNPIRLEGTQPNPL